MERRATRGERARVAADPALLARYATAFGPGAVDALRRSDDPEAAGPGASRSPFVEAEALRRRVFAPGASDEDRAAWQRAAAPLQAERDRVDAAVRAALDGLAPVATDLSTGSAVTAVAARGRVRPALVVLAALALVAGVAGIGLSTARVRAAPSASPTVSLPLQPPAIAGTLLVTMSDDDGAPPPSGHRIYYNSSTDPITAGGAAVAVGLRCHGVGQVGVQLSSGDQWTFACGRTEQTFVRVSDRAHTLPFFVLVPTTGPVVWSLTVSGRPVSEPAEAAGPGCACVAE